MQATTADTTYPTTQQNTHFTPYAIAFISSKFPFYFVFVSVVTESGTK